MRILTDPLESSLLCLVLCFSSDLPPQTKVRLRMPALSLFLPSFRGSQPLARDDR